MSIRAIKPLESGSGGVPSLIGGPLHRFGARLGLVDAVQGRSVPMGIAIGGVLWAGIALLALLSGSLDVAFSLGVLGGHVRPLVAIPLFFVCETMLGPHLRRLAEGLRMAEIVRGDQSDRFEAAIARFNAHVTSAPAEIACLLLAAGPVFLTLGVAGPGRTAFSGPEAFGPAGMWYFYLCLPVFRFLLLRWLWRLVQWNMFLWRVSRLDLHLVPTHPDRTGGLGYIAVVQAIFGSLLMAASAVLAASIAEEIASTGAALSHYYSYFVAVALIYAVIFILPLYVFARQLRLTRARGLASYMDFATAYVTAFEAKWMRGNRADQELLGTADLQSLADLGNSVRVVEEMRVAPVNQTLLMALALSAVVPFLPLLLFQFPLNQLIERVVLMLFSA
jgi:hypothetical protein